MPNNTKIPPEARARMNAAGLTDEGITKIRKILASLDEAIMECVIDATKAAEREGIPLDMSPMLIAEQVLATGNGVINAAQLSELLRRMLKGDKDAN